MKTLLLLAITAIPLGLHAQGTNSPLRLYGQGCGPLFSGSFQPGKLDLALSQAPKSSAGVLVLGLARLSVPTPTPGCTLLVQPGFLVLIQTDAAGIWKISFAQVPPVTIPLYAQTVFINPGPKPTWLASRGMKIGPQGTVQSAKEDFGNLANRDPDRDGAIWAKGNLLAGLVGGSGIHGDFDVRILGSDTKQKDSKGRTIYEMDAGNTVIPAGRSLSGNTIQVTDGRLDFMNFHLGKDEHLRFTGKVAPRIRATGTIVVEGALSVSAPDAAKHRGSPRPTQGQIGQAGGPGGALGGRGGDIPSITNGNVHGSAGGDLVYPKGHPYTSLYKGTGGGGSQANPTTVSAIQYSFFDVICQQVASGGAGGGYFDPQGKLKGGEGGLSKKNFNATTSPPKLYDYGAVSKGGIAIPIQKLVVGAQQSSTDLFLIGGSGGGGGGFHTVGSIKSSRLYQHAGAAGAGGGGILLLKAGGSLRLTAAGGIHAMGGNAQVDAYLRDQSPTPGGGGSGGSILLQSGNALSLLGTVSVLGGQGGFTDNSGRTGSGFMAVDSVSGAGGPGYIRAEAPTLPVITQLKGFQPPAVASNVALLRSPDHDPISAAMSRWYDTGSNYSPGYAGYVIQAQVGATRIQLSHDPKLGSRANTGPVILQVQGIRMDPNTRKPITGTETPWILEDVARLSDYHSQGYRFRLVFDRQAALNQAITVQSLVIQYVR